MRNLIATLAISVLILSCSKNHDSDDSTKVVIKGTISTSANVKSSRLKAGSSLSLSDARKVLVFTSNSYSVFNIENGSFTAKAAAGTACALSFLDANNRFIGCLQAGGLNVLPLVSLKDGDNTVIDLSTLTLDSTNVIPANNPLGKEIGLTDKEVQWYKEIGAYYESISKNIDVDNDGVIDILSNKGIRVSSSFGLYAGKWGVNDTPPLPYDTSSISIGYSMRIATGNAIVPSSANNVVLSGPTGDPYNDITQLRYDNTHDCFLVFFKRTGMDVTNFLPFKKGEYTLTIDKNSYTIDYATVCPFIYLILAEPTIHTNSNNEITSITLDYKHFDGSAVNPNNFVYLMQLQIGAENNQSCTLGASLYSNESSADAEKYTFIPTKTIQLSNVFYLDTYYEDLLGNEYNILWKKE
jgi:hypothetical protein